MAPKTSEKVDDLGHQLQKTPIAIIGMASIFPQATNLQEYWDNILNKINTVVDVPASRWSVEDYYDPDPSKPDKSYCKRGGFIPDIDFDPTEFGLPPNILEVTDVSQLLGLVVARDALEDAGYGEGREFKRQTTGVILGVVGTSAKLYVPLTARLQYPVWERVLRASGVSESDTKRIIEKIKLAYVGWEENSFPGSLTNIVAGRIANRFDLGGTNCVVDAACGTSLAAIRMSIMELIEGRADMMISGGVDTDNSIGVYMSFSKTPAFSKGQSVRTFDSGNDGMMAGEGIGMLVMKRLADAERDGDRIYAVIRGIGSSSDGRFKSIYAPRPSGQALALRRAYQEAGYSPSTVGLIEAHGTGTPAGDPAEFQGLYEVFAENNPNRQYIGLGSVKSQIAHTKGAAGAASMIKVALALYNKVLPPTINVNKPNPKLDLENSPFYLNTETRPWFRHDGKTPRRAGVSAFGFGGTNFHVTLEEYKGENTHPYRRNNVANPILLSAPTSAELLSTCQDTWTRMQADPGKQFYNELASSSESINVPLSHARLGFVAGSREEALELLQTAIDLLKQKPQEESWEHPKGIYFRKTGIDPKGKVVALFSGQGSQYLDMGKELACNYPPFRQVIAEMDDLFQKDGLKPISNRIYPPPVFEQEKKDQLSETLTRTEHAQPAIGVFSVSLYKLLQEADFAPDFVAGHSFGEITALWASGVITDQDYYYLAKVRGKAMSPPADPNFDAGTMLAVKADGKTVKEAIKDFPEITLANWNSDNQIVLAGAKPEIARIQKFLNEKGISAVLLPVSAAFHTSLVGHAQKPFAEALDHVTFAAPKVRLFSNSSGKAHSSNPDEIRKVMKGHILNPVLFKDEVENLYSEGGFIFVEFGPKNVLTNLVNNILNDRPHLAIALNATPKKDSDRLFRDAVLQLRVAGLKLKPVDPYQAPYKAPSTRKKSPVTIKLNGASYVSPKTRAAFETALNDGFKISSPSVQNIPAPVEKITQPLSTPTLAQPNAAISPIPYIESSGQKQVEQSMAATDPLIANVLGQNLVQLQEHQSEVVHLHEQYLRNEEEYGKIFAKLSEMEIALLSSSPQDKIDHIVSAFERLENSMDRFHEHQAETLRVHAQYLKSQEEFSQNFVRLAQQQYELIAGGVVRFASDMKQRLEIAPTPLTPPQPVKVLPAPERISHPTSVQVPVSLPKAPAPVSPPITPIPMVKIQSISEPGPSMKGNGAKPLPLNQPESTAAYDTKILTSSLLKVVSEKTGYPTEMLELDMDMESDLGIDSIKRVEIMGAMRELFPRLPEADPEAFAAARSLAQVVTYMVSRPLTGAVTSPEPVSIKPEPAIQIQSATTSISGGYDEQTLTTALLKVVSEKTGYPTEMLELDMDMESDLGIDSIKRVEIMGAMREQFPNLPDANPEAFAEARTLRQVVAYMSPTIAEKAAIPAALILSQEVKPEEVQHREITPVAPPQISILSEASNSTYDEKTLTSALLSVVSEKTGYPPEMLEMNMDMESDLGIDSIKRVEIMGAMRDRFPNLPEADPEAFAEARTLAQVVDYLLRIEPEIKKNSEPVIESKIQPRDPAFQRGTVSLKFLPEPDFLDFSLPDRTICLITDNGSPITARLAKELVERNRKVVVLSYPSSIVSNPSPMPENIQRVTLEDLSEEHLQNQLSYITDKYGPVAELIHINPSATGLKEKGIYSENEKEIVRHVFLLAKHLKEPLTSAAKDGHSTFMVVLHMDGEFGLGNKIDFDPVSGGLFGLVKTVNLEWEPVHCRAVDISPELGPMQATRLILAELFDPNRLITEVGYSPRGRSTLVVEHETTIEVMK